MVTMPPTVLVPLLLLLLPDEPPPQAPASSAVAASRLMTRSRRLIPFLLHSNLFLPLGMSSCDWVVFTRRPPARDVRAGGRRRDPARSRARWPPLLGVPRPRRALRP